MKEEKIKALRKELKYLLEEEIEKEVENYKENINSEEKIKDIANTIYERRGLNIDKIRKNHWNNLVDNFTEMIDLFKEKNKSTKRQMVADVIYMILLIMFVKIPFDLIQDIGYEFIEVLSNSLISKVWDLTFAILYLITVLCILFVTIKIFNHKYKNAK